MRNYIVIAAVVAASFMSISCDNSGNIEPTKASQSSYNHDMRNATMSTGLSKADLAWHAVNTYGWDCQEVVSKGEISGDYYMITCSNGNKLRVYPRSSQHPKITNENGGYK